LLKGMLKTHTSADISKAKEMLGYVFYEDKYDIDRDQLLTKLNEVGIQASPL